MQNDDTAQHKRNLSFHTSARETTVRTFCELLEQYGQGSVPAFT